MAEEIYITKISTTLYRVAMGYYPLDSFDSLAEAEDEARRYGVDQYQYKDGETRTIVSLD